MSIHMAAGVESFDAMAGYENRLFYGLIAVIVVLVVFSVLRFRSRKDVLGFVFGAIASALTAFLAFAGYFVGLARAEYDDNLQWLLAFKYIGWPMVVVSVCLSGLLLLGAASARWSPWWPGKRHG